jgi:thiaminase
MKKLFSIFKKKPKVQIKLSRDNVCASDDMELHDKIIETYLFDNPKKLISKIYKRYLPYIDGKGHIWECIFNGKLIAIIITPKLIGIHNVIAKTSDVVYSDNNTLYFKYIPQYLNKTYNS